MGDQLGLTERVAIALGGTIGGGIYAVLGVVAQLTMGATWFAFASLSFIVVFGAMSYLAFRERDHDAVNPVVPAVGVVGVVGFFPLLLYHHYTAEFEVFTAVVLIAAAIGLVETVYFERETVRKGLVEFADDVAARLD